MRVAAAREPPAVPSLRINSRIPRLRSRDVGNNLTERTKIASGLNEQPASLQQTAHVRIEMWRCG
jgi:hypothetical protein